MAYIDPKSVDSPRANWKLLHLLRNGEVDGSGDDDAALAIGAWDELDGNGPSIVLAIRWNGSKNKPGLGHPQSRGIATWFVIPYWMNDSIVNSRVIPSSKKAIVKALLASN